jgi:hypothetical protein
VQAPGRLLKTADDALSIDIYRHSAQTVGPVRRIPMTVRCSMIAVAAGLALSACSNYEKIKTTTFEPSGSRDFTFKAIADAGSPIDSSEAEKQRLAWLEEYLAQNRFCQKGYSIRERRPVLKSKGLIGDIYDVYYYGNCD